MLLHWARCTAWEIVTFPRTGRLLSYTFAVTFIASLIVQAAFHKFLPCRKRFKQGQKEGMALQEETGEKDLKCVVDQKSKMSPCPLAAQGERCYPGMYR